MDIIGLGHCLLPMQCQAITQSMVTSWRLKVNKIDYTFLKS